MRTSQPKLSILIATQGRRNEKFVCLLDELKRQISRKKSIEVIAYWNNGELPIGEIRNALLEEARGEYICYIDDDDWIPEYYIQEILDNMGEDYIGFKVKLYNEGDEQKPVYHDLQYQVWTEDDEGFYRGVTHLNPIKRELALQGEFHNRGSNEDEQWAKSVVDSVKTQKYIDKVMYFYMHDRRDSSFGGDLIYSKKNFQRPKVKYKFFKWHPKSKEKRND